MFVVVVGLLVNDRTVEGKAPVGRTEERRLETLLQRQPRGPLRKAPVMEEAVACCTGRSMRTTQGSSARSSMGCACRNFILRGSSRELQYVRMMLIVWDGDGVVVEDETSELGPPPHYAVPVEVNVVMGQGVGPFLALLWWIRKGLRASEQ